MKNKKILIYGANGYTGKLFAKHLIEKGIRPILAGRSNKVVNLAKEMACESMVFSIENAAENIKDIDALINLAGPFSITQESLIKACIEARVHYLDIAGEYNEVKKSFEYSLQARKAGIIVLPAAGFGVVPTDIAAKTACDLIEKPTRLTIAFATEGGVSRGTLKTVLKDIHKSGVILTNGKYEKAFAGRKEMQVNVFDKTFKAVNNPWRADLFTAKLSTKVEHLETYSEFPGLVVSMMKGKLLWLRNMILKSFVQLLPEGPSEKQLKKGNTFVRVEALNEDGKKAVVELKGPEAYYFTIICLHKMLELIFQSKLTACLTPSALGTEWIKQLDNVEIKSQVF
jgi:short subunit dehydrogenase-like uncharacterized protein